MEVGDENTWFTECLHMITEQYYNRIIEGCKRIAIEFSNTVIGIR